MSDGRVDDDALVWEEPAEGERPRAIDRIVFRVFVGSMIAAVTLIGGASMLQIVGTVLAGIRGAAAGEDIAFSVFAWFIGLAILGTLPMFLRAFRTGPAERIVLPRPRNWGHFLWGLFLEILWIEFVIKSLSWAFDWLEKYARN